MLSAIQTDIEKRFASLDQTELHIGAAGAGLTKEQQGEYPQVRYFINTSYDLCTGSHVGPYTIALFFIGKDRELAQS